MNQNTERELKLMLTREKYLQICRALPFDIRRIQTNTYYDTPDGKLLDTMTAVRIRTWDDHCILTVKKPQDSISKYEYEREIHTKSMDDLDEEEKAWIEQLGLPSSGLKPVVCFTTDRRILNLPDAEVSLDENRFTHTTDYEIEYEYRSDHDGISAFNRILKPFGLCYKRNGPGKYARALNDLKSGQ